MRRVLFALLVLLNLALGAVLGLTGWGYRESLRAAMPAPSDVFVIDRELGYAPNPAHPLNNPQGFRGTPFRIEKSDGVTRIVFLGDSSTYGSQRDGYVEQLGQKHSGRCEMINGASSALDVLTLYVRYERDVLPLDPDIVVVALPSAHFTKWRPSIGSGLLAFGLDRIKALASQNGQSLYLIAMPVTRSSEVKRWPVGWGPVSQATEEAYLADLYQVMRDSGVPMLDAANEIDWPTHFFRDQIHLHEDGYDQMTGWLDEQLFAGLCSN